MTSPAIDYAALSQPTKFDGSVSMELQEGKDYYFCRCGLSKTGPFCDGSHSQIKETGIKPLKFTAKKTETAYLCACKQSENLPFCDGSHRKEKGVKKYNAFLLARNSSLKSQLEFQETTVKVLGGALVALVAVTVAVILRKK